MGKINSIIVDNWKKLGLVFGNVAGIVEIVNAKAVALLLVYISKTLVTAHKWKSDVIKVKSWSMDSLHTTMVSAHRMQDSWIDPALKNLKRATVSQYEMINLYVMFFIFNWCIL